MRMKTITHEEKDIEMLLEVRNKVEKKYSMRLKKEQNLSQYKLDFFANGKVMTDKHGHLNMIKENVELKSCNSLKGHHIDIQSEIISY